MSHFSVLVVTDDPGEEALAKILQPYHEFESTGIDDAYVQEVDVTAQARADWLKYRDPAQSFAAFCVEDRGLRPVSPGETPDRGNLHKYGHLVVDGTGAVLQVIDRTNPQNKWDWWALGGRYADRLVSRALMSQLRDTPSLPEDFALCDQCQVGDLDLETMHHRRKVLLKRNWDEAQQWDESKRFLLYDIRPGLTEAHYLDVGPVSAFAILDATGWYERGSMGWWGIVSNVKDDWDAIFQAYLENLLTHREQYVAIVDCHI